MSKIKYIKIQQNDGSFSSNIPIGANAINVDMQDGTDVEEKIGLIEDDIQANSGRLDLIEAGTTASGDEVVGIRTAVDGTVYANAGTAVRQQIKQITRSIPVIDQNDIYTIKHYRYDTGESVEPPITIDASLSVTGAAADAKITGDKIRQIPVVEAKAVKNQNDQYEVQWFLADDAHNARNPQIIESIVDDWLDEHPEATTTVQDGSLQLDKFNKDVNSIIGKTTRVLAHRGYTTDNNPYCQDNSVYAFVNAAINGFNGFEVDLRKDKYGVIVCLHNATVDDISGSSGNITTLSYSEVLYKTKSGENTNTHLTTIDEMLLIAKAYNMFVLFDMGKGVVSCSEVVEKCNSAEFYNYGFFNVSNINDLISVPSYVIKVLGNDVFIHTEQELNDYINTFGSSKNLGVRITSTSGTDEQINLIKSKGFLIFQNINTTNDVGNVEIHNMSMIDFILGDNIPSIKSGGQFPFSNNLAFVHIDIKTYVDLLEPRCAAVVQGISNASLPTSSNYFIFIQKPSGNYIKLIAINAVATNNIYTLTKYNGTWDNEWTPLNARTEIINETNTDYNIAIYGYCAGNSVTFSISRESNHVTSSGGWTLIGEFNNSFAPPQILTCFFSDGAGNSLKVRIMPSGKIFIYNIPNTQIGCVFTYTI